MRAAMTSRELKTLLGHKETAERENEDYEIQGPEQRSLQAFAKNKSLLPISQPQSLFT